MTSFDSPAANLLVPDLLLNNRSDVQVKSKEKHTAGYPAEIHVREHVSPKMLAKCKKTLDTMGGRSNTQENINAHYCSPECLKGCGIDHVCS